MTQIYKQKNLRKARFSQANQIYHITTTTLNRNPIFKDFALARQVINAIKQADSLGYTTTLAFVHIHWLIQLGNKVSLQQVIRSMKSQTVKCAGAPIWQAGYYDHAMRKDEDTQAIARYIIQTQYALVWLSVWAITRIGMLFGCNSGL